MTPSRLEREAPNRSAEVIPGYVLAKIMRAAVKRTMRGMEGQ